MKYLLENSILCLFYSIQNSIFNYEELENSYHYKENVINVPERFYKIIDKQNQLEESDNLGKTGSLDNENSIDSSNLQSIRLSNLSNLHNEKSKQFSVLELEEKSLVVTPKGDFNFNESPIQGIFII